MGELKKFHLGEKLATFPGGTINSLIDAELERRAAPAPRATYEGTPAPEIVLVTETIPAATWSDASKKLFRREVNARRLVKHADLDGSFTPLGETLLCYSFYQTAITISADKARIGIVVAGVLFLADCAEIDFT